MKGYSTREVSEALGFPTSTILAWARGGLITPARGPRGAYVFSFQDIAVLRAARELLQAELSARSVREALESLRDQMPAGRPLSAVRLEALGRRVLVRDRGTLWEPATGQLQLDLDAAPTPGEPGEPEIVAHPFPGPRGGEPGSPGTADEWYDRAVDLESTSRGAAKGAYRRAL
ncbi:MAG TPA: helix-turn-helix domain-containing protein, partial [Longimicrobiales bacterium]|nr:helix-turn-helix domain-containing protein [Longimicrobiales bacterium]